MENYELPRPALLSTKIVKDNIALTNANTATTAPVKERVYFQIIPRPREIILPPVSLNCTVLPRLEAEINPKRSYQHGHKQRKHKHKY